MLEGIEKLMEELLEKVQIEKGKQGYLDALNDLAEYAKGFNDATILQAFIDAITELKKNVE